jgi:thiamine pyrophosphate-dependent acetolactate synthase large subunit-like protein
MKKAQNEKGPSLIEFIVEEHGMVFPMVPAGVGLHEMIQRPYPENGQTNTQEETVS